MYVNKTQDNNIDFLKPLGPSSKEMKNKTRFSFHLTSLACNFNGKYMVSNLISKGPQRVTNKESFRKYNTLSFYNYEHPKKGHPPILLSRLARDS